MFQGTIQKAVCINVWGCPTCGILFGIPQEYQDQLRRSRGHCYCPNGHTVVWGASTKEITLQNERDRLANELARERAAKDQIEAAKREAESKLAALNRRIGAGVCPCCGRSFAQLRRHIEAKHPAYKPKPREKQPEPVGRGRPRRA